MEISAAQFGGERPPCGHRPRHAPFREHASIRGEHLRNHLDIRRQAAIVLDGDFHIDARGTIGDLGGIHVRPGSLEKAIQRQRDMQAVADMQIHVAIDAAMRRMPVRAVPRQIGLDDRRHVGLFGERVIGHHGNHVLRAETQPVRDVETEWDETGLADAEQLSVEIHLGNLAHGFEFDDDLLTAHSIGRGERLAIPGATGPQIHFADVIGRGPIVERIHVVKCMRQGDVRPRAIVEIDGGGVRRVGLDELPIGIEVQLLAIRGQRQGQQNEKFLQNETASGNNDFSAIDRIGSFSGGRILSVRSR